MNNWGWFQSTTNEGDYDCKNCWKGFTVNVSIANINIYEFHVKRKLLVAMFSVVNYIILISANCPATMNNPKCIYRQFKAMKNIYTCITLNEKEETISYENFTVEILKIKQLF